MSWALVALGAIAVVAGVAVAIGSTLPRDHVATVRARFSASPVAVWAVIADPLSAATWRPAVKKVVALPDRDGQKSWSEETGNGTITYVLVGSEPPRTMTTRIADGALPFGGQWEYVLQASQQGSELAITERGFVKPALFRFMARYVFGYTSTMQDYLVALGVKLGERTTPEVVSTGR